LFDPISELILKPLDNPFSFRLTNPNILVFSC
jgi:hypothetical protein